MILSHWFSRLTICAALLALPLLGCPKSTPSSSPPQQQEPDDAPSLGPGPSGSFDYYVLSLSWSPQFCNSRKFPPSDQQCGEGRRFGFVVHGLWPQYEKGYPESCQTGFSLAQPTVEKALQMMPSQKLIEHEWQKHGTCSGLSAEQYFAQVETAFAGLVIPEPYRQPTAPVVTSLAELKQSFLAANPRLTPSSLTAQCSGTYLREVRICLHKDLSPMPCTSFVRDACKAPEVQLRPVRHAP
ncbi:MAG: ribonuclease T2 [Myxococcales bacterium]|nr:ribonuclease T2 [Myxococcales bacterium]